MNTEPVSWFSDGERIAGLWRTPEASGPYRAIVQGPGWLGLKDSKLYVRYHEALTSAGFAVLVFDYRGFGDSDGDSLRLSPASQLEDLHSAVTYLCTRPDVIRDSIGVFGSGGTGGGNAVLLASADSRVQCAVSQVPVADGRDWLHRMRSEYDWLQFLDAIEANEREKAISGGPGALVSPREEIMVPTAERRTTKVKSDVDARVPDKVQLSSALEILSYRPIDAAETLHKPLLVVSVDRDATTPTDHAIRIFESARGPRKLITQRHTSHYAAYDKYWETVTPQIVSWFDRYLGPADLVTRSQSAAITTEHLEAQ